jgi:hypothetical protein
MFSWFANFAAKIQNIFQTAKKKAQTLPFFLFVNNSLLCTRARFYAAEDSDSA